MPYYIVLIFYAVVVVLYLVGSVFTFYHIFSFGIMNTTMRFMVGVYLLFTAVIFVGSGWYIAQVDWSQRFDTSFFSDDTPIDIFDPTR